MCIRASHPFGSLVSLGLPNKPSKDGKSIKADAQNPMIASIASKINSFNLNLYVFVNVSMKKYAITNITIPTKKYSLQLPPQQPQWQKYLFFLSYKTSQAPQAAAETLLSARESEKRTYCIPKIPKMRTKVRRARHTAGCAHNVLNIRWRLQMHTQILK